MGPAVADRGLHSLLGHAAAAALERQRLYPPHHDFVPTIMILANHDATYCAIVVVVLAPAGVLQLVVHVLPVDT